MAPEDFGQILSLIHGLSTEQMQQLKRELDRKLTSPAEPVSPLPGGEEFADQEAQRRLLAAGVISEIKPSRRTSTPTEQFTPISIPGEPISATIVRERR
ncbi:MAG: hypothetical protein ABS79_01120 [Planctomycetes bacterium SCN 63-9]|nr:MAG: hypothetical protein ABS79_01120 [Planctomycetes bacterium SCN 63-9]